MNKIEIELPAGLAEFVEAQVQAGLYESVQDAIADAVRRVSEDDEAKAAAVRGVIVQGLADLDAGRFFEGTVDDIIAEAKATRASNARK